jgi:arylsulfatase A-like enzyme
MMSSPRNILLFLTDDHGQWAMGAYGNRELHTPTLDYLAKTGVQMMNAFTPTPVCSPARACLLTGKLASQHGIHDYLSSNDPTINETNWLAAEITLPQLLSEAGYQTGLYGKWHLGREEQPQAGFDYWFSPTGEYPRPLGFTNFSHNGAIQKHPGYDTPVITDGAIRYLQQIDKARPFFLCVGYGATHSPWNYQPERLVASYRNCTFEDIPADEIYPFGKQNLESTEVNRAEEREAQAQYYAAVSFIDEGIGHLLDELEALGLREDTLIVYTSDHGLNCGHHGIWGKGNGTLPLNMVEESIRIPLLFHQPGRLFGGQRRHEFTDHLDTFQTLVDYADLTLPGYTPKSYPGRSFLSLLDNSDSISDWRTIQFGEYGNLRMIRTETHKLVRRYPDGPCELFDLRRDPRETTNLFTDPAHQPVVQSLSACIDEYFSTYEDPSHSGLRVHELPRHNMTEAWRAEG